MTNSPLFWIAVGVGGVWGYHHWIKPLPGAKSS
jgi:hypothetical protein